MAGKVDQLLAQEFSCVRCGRKGSHVERLAMTGAGLSAYLDFRRYPYIFVSCINCGYTEVYNLRTLESKDDPEAFLKALFEDRAHT